LNSKKRKGLVREKATFASDGKRLIGKKTKRLVKNELRVGSGKKNTWRGKMLSFYAV